MTPSPIKRILTDDEHATRLASQFQRSDALPDDLAASIRAASMRARKTVTEGYLSPPSSSPTTPYSSPLKQAPSSIPASRFPLSAREASRQVFSSFSGGYAPLDSPSKRKRPDIDSHDDDELPIISSPDEQSEDQGEMVAESSGNVMEVDRLMKPLRRSGRPRETSPPSVHPLFPPAMVMSSLQCDVGEAKNMACTQVDSASDNEPQ